MGLKALNAAEDSGWETPDVFKMAYGLYPGIVRNNNHALLLEGDRHRHDNGISQTPGFGELVAMFLQNALEFRSIGVIFMNAKLGMRVHPALQLIITLTNLLRHAIRQAQCAGVRQPCEPRHSHPAAPDQIDESTGVEEITLKLERHSG